VGTAAISSLTLNEVSNCHKAGARLNNITNTTAISSKIFFRENLVFAIGCGVELMVK
jgi:hypothetical protein